MAISQLSGGQKQLLNIAVALAAKPDILILDEPTAMLDPGARDRIEAIVQKITRRGTTVIWITHHLEEATLCDRIIAIDRGLCVYDGQPESFFYETETNEKTMLINERLSPCERLGLDPPFTVKTALLLKHKGMRPEAMPLRSEQLAKEVARWRSN
ncbi:ATP-binding cassette domain-containing protein [Paenibacillus amylolyticus]|nr:ATP-binding cassette domain-containing protein [Paenibacillus amylolyticus]WFR61463.1 ATP-binding cassette domain-containing protein [Paenibacillus amylolyticus]